LRSRLLLGAALAVVVGVVTAYVIRSTDRPKEVRPAAAEGAFDRHDQLDPGIERAIYSPDGSRLAVVAGTGIGLAQAGRVQLVTPRGSSAVDAAWMPDSQSLLIAEGPSPMTKLSVLDLDGREKGVAKLDQPFAVGAGNGIAVDSRGARAVFAAETRDTIGGRRRLDLVLVDLPTGHVEPLTATAEANEGWPVFVDDSHVAFSRADAGHAGVVTVLDLASREERAISGDGEAARPIGVARGALVYETTTPDGGLTVWIVKGGRRVSLGRPKAAETVWTVDPSGTRGVATVSTTDDAGIVTTNLRAVTLKAPAPG
jgi:hypothetical protein